MKRKRGTVYFVGAGPGDPGLITVRGARLLEEADVIVYDWLINADLLQLAPAVEKIYVGKQHSQKVCHPRESGDPEINRLDSRFRGNDQNLQENINRLLLKLARTGKKVVRLKGGDPFIFGRGAEEASYLRKRGIAFQIVPGITAGYAVPAYAGIPVTDRRHASSVTFVTAHEDPTKKESQVDWKHLARQRGTLVLFMGVGNLDKVTRLLIQEGKSAKTPAAVITWGTFPFQNVIEGTLANISKQARAAKIQSPALIVIGEVTKLRKELGWFEKRPLWKKKILITRPKTQASSLRKALEAQGGEVIEFPAIEILPPDDSRPLERELENLKNHDWIIFTSTNVVNAVFQCLEKLKRDTRVFAQTKIAAVGESTAAALVQRGLRADLIPSTYTSNALTDELASRDEIANQKFLLPRTDIAPPELAARLLAGGAFVTEVMAYRTRAARQNAAEKNKIRGLLEKGKIDYVTFTSASTVKHFFEGLKWPKKRPVPSRLISIGPVTTQAIKSYGFKPYLEATEHTIPGLVEALINGR